MKKVFVTFLAVASVIACTKSNVEFEETTEIGLKPVAHNVTKSMMIGTSFAPSESFNVWAFYKQVNPGTSIADWQKSAENQTTYIDEKEFVNKDATTWKGKTSYYWPKMGSLLFAGYYPTTIANQVEYTFNATDNKMVISNYEPKRVVNPAEGKTTTYTEDLMYANMTPASVIKNNVSLVFKHALSWITVKAMKNTADGPTIVLNSVKFSGIYPKGTATINNVPTSSTADGKTVYTFDEIKWDTDLQDNSPKDVEVQEEECEVLKADGKTKETVDGVKLSGTEYKLPYEPLFIPQGMNKLTIVYTIISEDGSQFKETKELVLANVKDSNSKAYNNWEAGKHYTYTITIGTDEILIAPTVTDWVPVDYAITPGVEAQL